MRSHLREMASFYWLVKGQTSKRANEQTSKRVT